MTYVKGVSLLLLSYLHLDLELSGREVHAAVTAVRLLDPAPRYDIDLSAALASVGWGFQVGQV